jgi:hypothetical protein
MYNNNIFPIDNTNAINSTTIVSDVGNVPNNQIIDNTDAHRNLFSTMFDIKTIKIQANRLVKDPFEQKMLILTKTDGAESSKKEALFFFGQSYILF